MMKQITNKISVKISDQDSLSLEYTDDNGHMTNVKVVARGCFDLLKQAQALRQTLNGPISDLKLPSGSDHTSLLARELILRVKGQWLPPYLDDEICHCRAVETRKVIESIYTGARTALAVSQQTTASTSCGTCRPDVEAMLGYIIGHHKKLT